MPRTDVSIRTVRWDEAQEQIRRIRETVFIEEQKVPPDLEWDGLDPDCVHILALNENGLPIGTGRMTEEGRIGRMAVLKEWRGRGVGDAVLAALLRLARRRRLARVTLAAQTYALAFYERHSFRAVGDVFPDAGIPHREMYLDL